MARILIAWELGGGLGHVGPLRAIGGGLARRGHSVALATPAPNLPLCRQALVGSGIDLIRAPALEPSTKVLKYPCTYADILHDSGYSSADNVAKTVAGWLQLFDRFQPELLLSEFAPTALLASQLRSFAAASLGTGFVCPPDTSPLPSLHQQITEPHWAGEVEQTVLGSMNAALAMHDGAPLSRVTEVFSLADRRFLLTLEELDHYRPWRSGDKCNVEYWQPLGTLPGQPVAWPAGPGMDDPGAKVFLYLRDDVPVLPILEGLAFKRIPTICYAPRISEASHQQFAGTSVRVCLNPIDIRPLLNDCTAAVLHGGHGTVCDFLLAGVPMLLLPLSLEQQLTAARIVELGAGLTAPPADVPAIAESLERVVGDPEFTANAPQFAAAKAVIDEQAAIHWLAEEIATLVPDEGANP